MVPRRWHPDKARNWNETSREKTKVGIRGSRNKGPGYHCSHDQHGMCAKVDCTCGCHRSGIR